ncbi:MAG: CDP-2,3-bis-(O-geranylgeranyl)-sn-glycerol synthase [Methanobrevibacter sp.]|jgi:CDP-2,3-bis-(O-geranylgeranyl)-sn-glycerol synthase|nr:CDP-2,3-bis-(O-geranylgeranyl)-sn-glycerol synthase [Candidatus Methanoflexus mossambicus]
MQFDLIYIVILIINAIYFFLPAYISNLSGLVFGGGKPIDFGKNFFDKRRIIGDGVTWKGLIYGVIISTLVGGLQGYAYINFFIGTFIADMPGFMITNILNGLIIGFLLGLGALGGDAVGSFIKRRLNISRGKPAPILDQLDFFIGAVILVSIVLNVDANIIVTGAIITLVLHLITNTIAYLLKIKSVWY